MLLRRPTRPAREPTGRPKRRPYRVARWSTTLGLLGIGIIGLANSWGALYSAAADHMADTGLPTVTIGGVPYSTAGASIPLLLDVLIAVATSRYVIGVLETRPVAGWRVAAHAAIAATVIFNGLAARRPGDVLWHVIAPGVLSIVIELVARETLGTLRDDGDTARPDAIPARLWITCPAESWRVAWRMLRTGQQSASAVRQQTERCAAVRDDLRLAMPGLGHYRDRRRILRRLWSGELPPDILVRLIVEHEPDARALLRGALRAVACPEGIVPRALVGTEAGGHEACPMPTETGHEGIGTSEARGIEAERYEAPGPCLSEAREACPPLGKATEARHQGRPQGSRAPRLTLEDIDEALRDGTLTALSRNPLKARFELRSNSTADRLIKAYRSRGEETARNEEQGSEAKPLQMIK